MFSSGFPNVNKMRFVIISDSLLSIEIKLENDIIIKKSTHVKFSGVKISNKLK